ncbi:hypothetical protein ACO0LC_02595 [Undibacterium sp. JH2W]|uniref:hypothetical protein n=1 Tax=Undibacterium sp. JH2W TaxID=3413037 RepID=UPI003BF26AC9
MQGQLQHHISHHLVRRSVIGAAAAMVFLLLAACSFKGEEKFLGLTDWLRVRHVTATGDQSAPAIAGDQALLQYALRKPQKWGFIAYDDWVDLDYDKLNVLDDKNILVARSLKYAKARYGKNLKPADLQVRLMTADGEQEINICASSDSINGPANTNFIDCVDSKDARKLTIKRMDFQGKLLQTLSMAANEWEDLSTQKNIAYYDEHQQAYILEVGKGNTYCRLVMPAKEKSLSFVLDLKDASKKCDDMAAWAVLTQKKLSNAHAFEDLGKNAQIWKKLTKDYPRWAEIRASATNNTKEALPAK